MRTTTTVLWSLLAVAGIGALGLWALAGAAPRDEHEVVLEDGRARPQGDLLVMATAAPIRQRNLLTCTDSLARNHLLARVYDTLARIDEDEVRLVPAVVRDWQPGREARTFELELRDDVVFADGTPMQVEDVLLPFELAAAGHPLPGSIWPALRAVEHVEPSGPWRLRLTLREAGYAALERVLVRCPVVCRAAVEDAVAAAAHAAGDAAAPAVGDPRFGELLLGVSECGPGSGPYRLASATDRELLLLQNEHSWQRATDRAGWNLAGIRLRHFGDPAALRAALGAGDVDFAPDRDPEATLAADATLAREYRALVYGYRTIGVCFIVWNHERAPFRDAGVRRALGMAMDTAAIARLLGPRAEQARGWFHPAYGRDDDVPPLGRDLGALRPALRGARGEAEGAKPLELELLVHEGTPDHRAALELCAADLARAGVVLTVQSAAVPVLQQRIGARDFDGYVYFFSPDVWNDGYAVFHSSQATATGMNWMRYRSAAADRALEAVRGAADQEARQRAFHELASVLRDEQPVTVLYYPRSTALLHRRFQGRAVTGAGFTPRFLWVEPSAQRHRVRTTPR